MGWWREPRMVGTWACDSFAMEVVCLHGGAWRERHMTKRLTLIILSTVLMGLSAGADIIYDNRTGPGGEAPGVLSEEAYLDGGAFLSIGNFPLIVLDDFVLDEDCLLSDIHWYGMPDEGEVDTFQIAILTLVPDSPLFEPVDLLYGEEVTATGEALPPVGPDQHVFYSYDHQLSDSVHLLAGQQYYLTVSAMVPAGSPAVWGWGSTYASPGDPAHSYLAALGEALLPMEMEFAYYLTGEATEPPVPEPATVSLLGLGLLGLIARGLRRER